MGMFAGILSRHDLLFRRSLLGKRTFRICHDHSPGEYGFPRRNSDYPANVGVGRLPSYLVDPQINLTFHAAMAEESIVSPDCN